MKIGFHENWVTYLHWLQVKEVKRERWRKMEANERESECGKLS